MNCVCNAIVGGQQVDFSTQSGDSFQIYLTYEDGKGGDFFVNDVAVCLYQGRIRLFKATTEDGTIERTGNLLRIDIDHDTSKSMVGTVEMEVTMYDRESGAVDHADRVITINFAQRRNNDLI